MKPQPKSEGWREAIWAGRLDGHATSEVTARLRAGGVGEDDLPTELREEVALNALLTLGSAPSVSNNFVGRVQAQIAGLEQRAGTQAGWKISWWRFQWAAGATGLALLAAVSLVAVERSVRGRDDMARNVVDITRATAVPGIAALRDFDAIAALTEGARPHPGDVDLMAAMAE